MQIKEITDMLERWANPSLQESYDNAGLLLGDRNDDCSGALITLDVTEEVVDEAIANGLDLIIAHHPLIFKGLKRLGKKHWIDRCVRKAIQHDIAIYAIHTNLDHVHTGVNHKICERIGLQNLKVLQPKNATLAKLTVFVPEVDKEPVLDALFNAGAGNIGNYDHCSFQVDGMGSFRGNDQSTPAFGTKGSIEHVKEARIEVLIRKHELRQVLHAMKAAHPYEEVAYYVSELLNENQEIGAGMMGTLPAEMSPDAFFDHLKKSMNLKVIKATSTIKESIRTVAVCGGSGSFLLSTAKAKKADVFITADFKYHEYFEANGEVIIADIGHYESEVYTKDLLHDELSKTFANFAFHLSKVDTNPIKYL